MCEEQARKKTNKNIEKVNNSQKSMILRKFLFLVEFEPSASYKNNSYKNKQCIMDEFKAISFATLDDVLPCYTLIKHIIHTFNGDAEKFYPEFYKVLSDAETPFTGLSRHSTFLVGFELTNHVLALPIILAASSKMIRC